MLPKPLPTSLWSEGKTQIISSRNCLLWNVKEYIVSELNLATVNFNNKGKVNYEMTIISKSI